MLELLSATAEPLQISYGGLQTPQKNLCGLSILAQVLTVQNTAPFSQPGACLQELGGVTAGISFLGLGSWPQGSEWGEGMDRGRVSSARCMGKLESSHCSFPASSQKILTVLEGP